jgi:hypothetical protein
MRGERKKGRRDRGKREGKRRMMSISPPGKASVQLLS